jgi:hypothetical protein
MIGVETTFLVQLELPAGVRHLLTSNPADFQIFGFHLFVP